jgi:hypothetical protein
VVAEKAKRPGLFPVVAGIGAWGLLAAGLIARDLDSSEVIDPRLLIYCACFLAVSGLLLGFWRMLRGPQRTIAAVGLFICSVFAVTFLAGLPW